MKYDIPAALQKLTPGAEWVVRGDEYSGLEWLVGNGHDKPTEAALTAKIAELDGAEAMRLLREERDCRIAKSDWKVVMAKETGSNLSSAFKTYRQALRDLPANTSDPANPTWPTKP